MLFAMNRLAGLLLAGLVSLWIHGCGGGDCANPNPDFDATDPTSEACLDPAETGTASAQNCVPGTQQECACPGVYQECKPDGSGYTSCDCAGDAPGPEGGEAGATETPAAGGQGSSEEATGCGAILECVTACEFEETCSAECQSSASPEAQAAFTLLLDCIAGCDAGDGAVCTYEICGTLYDTCVGGGGGETGSEGGEAPVEEGGEAGTEEGGEGLPTDGSESSGEGGENPVEGGESPAEGSEAANEGGENPEEVCVPSCGGNECGPDGCGGTCGTCSGNGECADGECLCPSNWAGENCDVCAPNWEGTNCDSCSGVWEGDACQTCPSNWAGANCDVCSNGWLGAACEYCPENWSGPNCDTCAANWTGENCGTCSGGWEGDACQTCPSNWAGANCDVCSNGWLGAACEYCPENWSGPNCDTCAANWSGENCGTCIGGWSGEGCQICPTNWAGENCDTCAANWAGEDCSTCSNQWTGSECKECPEPWWGTNCNLECLGVVLEGECFPTPEDSFLSGSYSITYEGSGGPYLPIPMIDLNFNSFQGTVSGTFVFDFGGFPLPAPFNGTYEYPTFISEGFNIDIIALNLHVVQSLQVTFDLKNEGAPSFSGTMEETVDSDTTTYDVFGTKE